MADPVRTMREPKDVFQDSTFFQHERKNALITYNHSILRLVHHSHHENLFLVDKNAIP